jgi:hypothetical protein
MRRTRFIAPLVAVPMLVAGCGSSTPAASAHLDQARSVVERFAAATDASACNLLSNNAVKAVYGKFTDPAPKARANCARVSRRFKGEKITIIKTSLLNPVTAKVNAHSADGKFTYSVNLIRKPGPGKPWRIDGITQSKLVG